MCRNNVDSKMTEWFTVESNRVANIKHYECQNDFERINQVRKDVDFGWSDVKRQGKCEAQVITDFIREGRVYDENDFSEEIMNRYIKNLC